MTSQVAPFSGKAGGISIADFPSEVQETLKVFDADGSGSVQPGELALAAKMFQGEFACILSVIPEKNKLNNRKRSAALSSSLWYICIRNSNLSNRNRFYRTLGILSRVRAPACTFRDTRILDVEVW